MIQKKSFKLLTILSFAALLSTCIVGIAISDDSDDSSASSYDTTIDVGILYSQEVIAPYPPSTGIYTITGASWLSASADGHTITVSGTPTTGGIYSVSMSGPIYGGGETYVWNWTITVRSLEMTLTDGSTQVISGGYLNWKPSISPSDAHLTITQNTTGCNVEVVTSGGSDYLRGTLTDILPGTYYISFTASASGYYDKSATLAITVPVFVYEPVTDTVPIDTSWQYNLTANPSSSKIASFTLYKDGTQISNNTNGVTASKTNKVFTFSSSETGTYRAILLISATGYTSTTKELVLTVYDSGEIVGDPYVESILVTPHASLPGGFYLSAVGAVNYTSLTWDFGDGSSSASGVNVIHRFTSNGPSTVTVTAYNSYNGHSYVESSSFVVVIENTFYNDAWVGVPYTYTLQIDQANMEGNRLSLVTDAAQSWLSIGLETDSTGSYITLSGTPLSGFADTDLSISVTYDGTSLISYVLHIWPAYEEGDYELAFDLVVDGYTVTLTNTGPSGLGVIMYIDWGSSDIDGTARQTSSITASATYHQAGQYRIAMTLVVNGIEYGGPSQFVTVPSSAASFTIVYHANGGSGTMSNTSGTSVYVSQNSFVSDGYTFQSWNTKQDGSGIAYSPGASITLESNLNLYAIWTAVGDDHDPEEEDNDKDAYITAIAILIVILIAIVLSVISGLVPASIGAVACIIDIILLVLTAILVVFT